MQGQILCRRGVRRTDAPKKQARKTAGHHSSRNRLPFCANVSRRRKIWRNLLQKRFLSATSSPSCRQSRAATMKRAWMYSCATTSPLHRYAKERQIGGAGEAQVQQLTKMLWKPAKMLHGTLHLRLVHPSGSGFVRVPALPGKSFGQLRSGGLPLTASILVVFCALKLAYSVFAHGSTPCSKRLRTLTFRRGNAKSCSKSDCVESSRRIAAVLLEAM
mmetsp:Transcript_12742/g.22194  ORF Transcript_12742/g.22194 Transcript_12742/m.22194 type:complete len:217 (+) Transcript_12742:870-1520(+)